MTKATQVRAEFTLPPKKCCICGKEVHAYYGSWRDGGTCSCKCEERKEAHERARLEDAGFD